MKISEAVICTCGRKIYEIWKVRTIDHSARKANDLFESEWDPL